MYSLVEEDVAAMRALADEMDARVSSARSDWLSAERALGRAATEYGAASREYALAAQDYKAAATRFRTVTAIIIAAAAWDEFVRGVCGPSVSTAQYRRELSARGVDLTGKDMDHIIAHARGGPDRPWNYNPLEASVNRSLQDGGLGWKFANFPLATLDAMAKFASSRLLCPVP